MSRPEEPYEPHDPPGRGPAGSARSGPGGPPSAGGPAAGQRFAPDFLTDLFRDPLDPGYAAAARRRAVAGPGGPAARRASRTVALVVLVATGFLFAVAYQHVVAARPAVDKARDKLVADIRARRDEADALQRQDGTLRDQVNRAREANLSAAEVRRLRDLEAAVGTAQVKGDGALVELTDAPAPVDPVTGKASGTNLGQVLDRDLQDVTNELWRDGAEAIAINDERLTATSTIRQAGGAILVDFQPVTGPYRVVAIGPGDLAARFAASGTGRRFRGYVSAYHMGVLIKALSSVTLPAAVEPALDYAHPLGAPSGSPTTGPPAGGATPGPAGTAVPTSPGGG